MRDSIFVSKVLLKLEVWHSLTKSQVEELEVIDRLLMRHTLDAHSKTGLECLYSDTAKLNLKSLIQIRRLMYLWQVLNRNECELVSRIYQTQKISNSVGDWVRQVEGDKLELGITVTDCEIQGVSQNKFVAKKVKTNHLNYLSSLKQKHSKAKFLNWTVLKQADYLADSRFSTKEKQLLFKLRSQ